MIYRSKTILFQLLFEHQFIACLPREDFLPTQSAYNHNGRHVKLNKVIQFHSLFHNTLKIYILYVFENIIFCRYVL